MGAQKIPKEEILDFTKSFNFGALQVSQELF